MIFSGDLCDKVLAGTKTQTRRPVKYVDGVEQPCQYKVGQTYAIQRKRGTHGLGPRLLVVSVNRVLVFPISKADARAEGFAKVSEFLARWTSFYGTLKGYCWRIEFVVGVEEPA